MLFPHSLDFICHVFTMLYESRGTKRARDVVNFEQELLDGIQLNLVAYT